MPGLYSANEYDLAGFIVGAVERNLMVSGSKIRQNDIILGLPSSGLHTNGYSLARKLIFTTASDEFAVKAFKFSAVFPILPAG